jgi:hypothetical protein
MAPDGTMHVEKVLTGLRAWGALRFGAPLVTAVFGSILLLEILTPFLARLLPGVPPNHLHFFVISIGLLLGVIGHFIADLWDRVVFARWYGPHGSWLDTSQPPLLVFPAGAELKRLRGLAVQALPKKPASDERIDREVVKVAQRQLERWERIEHPLILGQLVRGLLWPSVFAAVLAAAAAVLASPLGAAAVGPFLLAIGAAYVVLTLLVLVPYTRLRVEFLLRLYQDVIAHPAHPPKRKPEGRSTISLG